MSKPDEIKEAERNEMCNIVKAAHEFADADLQQRSWVNGEYSSSGFLESFEELVDDSNVEAMLEGDIAHLGCSDEMIRTLRRFVQVLIEFANTVPEQAIDCEVIALRGWSDVRSLAGEFLDAAHTWHKENCNEAWCASWTWRGKQYGPLDVDRPS